MDRMIKTWIKTSPLAGPAQRAVGSWRSARKSWDIARQNRKLSCTPDTVFVWIPKSSGSALFRQLEREIGMQKILSPDRFLTFPGHGAVTPSHVHWLSLVKSGLVPRHYHDAAFKFSVVRCPYERAASLFSYFIQQKRIDTTDIDVFLNDILDQRPPVGLYNYAGTSQANPQVDWLLDETGGFVVDRVYRLEDLDDLATELHQRYGAHIDLSERVNVSRQRISTEEMTCTPERLARINRIYRRDFELLGYNMRTI